jgi:Zn-dependent peptidase ImmA (M78 family)
MPGLDTNRGAKRAREARERLGLDDVSPIACALALVEERAGLPVVVGSLPDEVAGALWRNGVGAVVWINGDQAVERQRFTIAHELGHVCCGHEGTSVDTADTLSARTRDPREVQANAFAAELLAPRRAVEDLIAHEPTLEDLVRLAARFGISTIAALYRCRTLELVSTRRYERLKGEIDDGLHRTLWGHLGLEPLQDGLAAIDEHPRLPPSLAGSALAALLSGDASVSAAAGSAGCAADTLAAAAAALGR